MSEKRPIKFLAPPLTALIAGTASANISCEGDYFSLIERGNKALITMAGEKTYNGDCENRNFADTRPKNLVTCLVEPDDLDGFTWVFVLEPQRVLQVSLYEVSTPIVISGVTCTGFDDE